MRTATKSINLISKSWTFGPGRTDYFYGGIVVCAHEQFCCLFSCSLFFHCRSFSPCWPLAFLIFSPLLWNFMSFFQRNSPPLFLITLPSSFSVIHVNEDIKINVENTKLCYFFSVKVRVALGFPAKKTSSCFWFAIPVDWIILHWYTCGADGQANVRSCDYQNFSDA